MKSREVPYVSADGNRRGGKPERRHERKRGSLEGQGAGDSILRERDAVESVSRKATNWGISVTGQYILKVTTRDVSLRQGNLNRKGCGM